MKKSLTKNYFYNLIYQVLVLIIPLITTPYISRILGAENIGIYGFTLSISAYFILFGSLGISMYGQREIAYLQGKKEKYSVCFWEIIIIRFFTMSISLLTFYLVFVRNTSYSLYYKILILEIIGNCLDISWFFQGQEDFKRTVIRNLIVKIISVLSIFIFVKTSNDLAIYFWIYVISIVLGNISLWFYLPQYLCKVKLKELNVFRHIKPTFSLFLPQVAIKVYTLLDKTMIGTIISNKAEVGYYEQAQKIIQMVITMVTALGTVMMPRIANSYKNNDKEKIQQYMEKSFNLTFFLAFQFIIGIIFVANNFVPIFYGSGFEKVSVLMQIISPIILFIGLSNVTGIQFLLPVNRQKQYTISVLSGAVINLVLNSILIKKWGALGASIATVFAEFSVTLVQLMFVRKDFNIKKMIFLSKNYVIASLGMMVACLLVNFIKCSNLFSIILKCFIGESVYLVILLVLKDRFLNEIINKIIKKVLKGKVFGENEKLEN